MWYVVARTQISLGRVPYLDLVLDLRKELISRDRRVKARSNGPTEDRYTVNIEGQDLESSSMRPPTPVARTQAMCTYQTKPSMLG
jgi:hypothetical protein